MNPLFTKRKLAWTEMLFNDQANTFPPHMEPVLMTDISGRMAVCVFDRRSNDALLSFDFWSADDEDREVFDADGEKMPRSETCEYFPDPMAWMPLPEAPGFLCGSELPDVQFKAYSIMDAIEPAIKAYLQVGQL